MKVIDARSFDIPSDENDYDELVAFADTMACIPQFDAVPVEVLDKIRAEIKDIAFDSQEIDGEHESIMVVDLNEALQIIDKYKAESEE